MRRQFTDNKHQFSSTTVDMEEEYDYTTAEYEYDLGDSFATFHWEELAPTVVVYGLTLVLGLTGNCLIVFTTYRYRRMQTATNLLLSGLASADLLLINFCIPVKGRTLFAILLPYTTEEDLLLVRQVAKLFSYTWAMGTLLCKCVHYLQNVSTICSVLTLTAISIERYYAIVHPIRAKYICTLSQAKRTIAVTWILSFLLAAPILFVQIMLPVGARVKAYWCVRDWENTFFWRLHELYLLVLVLLGPACIMTFVYTLICWEVWSVMEKRYLMTGRQALSKQQNAGFERCESFRLTKSKRIKVNNNKEDTRTMKQVICMLVAVVVLFVLCWTPLLVDNVLTAYDLLPRKRQGFYKYMGTVFHLMAYFNSCINPIVYGFMSKSFRASCLSALCCLTDRTRKKTLHGPIGASTRQISGTGSHTRNTSIK